jgi:NitT/TauT family transport system substrate-binding protein
MTFKIMPHGRLHEWVADEEGYFAAEGLDYAFVQEGDYGMSLRERDEAGEIRSGAFETFGAGRSGANVSCACHWATNAAANEGAGRLISSVYSVAPSGVMVAPDSPIRRPEDLAGVPVGVGYHSGSHFATLQALEAVLEPDAIQLSFQGPPNGRLDALLDGQVPAATMWGVPLYIAESFGFRKVLDVTFMIGFVITGEDVSPEDVQKYLAALQRAQMAIDLHPERYKRHHLHAVPEKYRDQVDVRTFGVGERVVFLPYTREAFSETEQWTQARGLFPRVDNAITLSYDEVTVG